MHRLNRHQTRGQGQGVIVAVVAGLLMTYAFSNSDRTVVRRSAVQHPIHSICATQYAPGSDTFRSIIKAVDEASELYGVSAELISAVIATESNCQVTARSRKGAVGLMQLTPITVSHLGIADPVSVRENIFGGTKYLAQLLKTWNGNKELALASYNAGPSNVRKFNQIPPYKETQHYVKRVLHVYQGLSSMGYSRT